MPLIITQECTLQSLIFVTLLDDYYGQRGFIFTMQVIFMHWFYYFYSGVAFIFVALLHWQSQLNKEVILETKPLTKGMNQPC